jgi:photosystem II stability/assembly factor-like uncharacterized protein
MLALAFVLQPLAVSAQGLYTPSITSISPDHALVGSGAVTISIDGAGFLATATAQYNSRDVVTTFVSDTQLTAEIPAEALSATGTLSITVVNPDLDGGTSNPVVFTVNNPLPTLATISPDQKTAGDGGFTLTLNGSDFVPGSLAYWNGAELDTTFTSASQLHAQVPMSFIVNEGAASVFVRNPTPGGGDSSGATFTIAPRSNTWMSHSPEGGIVRDVAVDPGNPDVLYAGTSAAGLFKSIDGGQSWFPANNGIDSPSIESVIVSPANSSIVLACGQGIFRSENGGAFWKKISDAGCYISKTIKFDLQNPNRVYMAGGGVYRSLDAGKTWTSISGTKLSYSIALALDGHHPGTLYAIEGPTDNSEERLWKTENDGNTWTELTNGVPSALARTVEIDPSNPNIVWMGTEYGVGGSPLSGIYKSENAGATWTQVVAVPGYYYNIVFNRGNSNYIYVSTNSAIYTTSDGGQNWLPVNAPDASYIDTDPTNPAIIYGVGYHGIFKTEDSGANWTPIIKGLTALLTTGLVYAPQNNTLFVSTWTGGVWKSTDYGVNWDYTNFNPGYTAYVRLDPNNPNHLFSGYVHGGNYETLDGGASWSQHSFAPSPETFAFAANSDLYASKGMQVFKSTDNGYTWQEKSTGLVACPTRCFASFISTDPVDANTIYAAMRSIYQDPVMGEVSTGYLYKTTDGGDTWVSIMNGITNGYLHHLAVDPVDRSVLYVSTYDGIFKSTDGGATWAQASKDLQYTDINMVAVDPHNNMVVYAGSEGTGVYRSMDGGKSWSSFNYGMSSGYVRGIVPIPPSVSPSPTLRANSDSSNSISRVYSISGGTVYAYFSVNYAPTSLALSSASVAGKMPIGTPVGNFTTTDSNVGDTFTYALVSGEGGADNASFSISGNTLKTTAVFDQDIKSSYSILARSTDSGGLYFDKAFTINIGPNSNAPILVSPSAGEQLLYNKPTFDWENVPDAATYTIQLAANQSFTLGLTTFKITASNYTPASLLSPKRTFYWRVRRNTASGTAGTWSQVRNFNTANPPGVPQLVSPASASLVTNYQPKLDWSTVTLPAYTAFDHYQVQLATDVQFNNIQLTQNVAGIGNSFYTLTSPLSPNAIYYWRVRSFNSQGQYSIWSAVKNFRTVIVPPSLVSPLNGVTPNSLSPSFDWSDVVGASKYTIQFSKSPVFSSVFASASSRTSSYTRTANLPANIVFYWRVQALGANGPSAWSTPRSFTSPNPPGTSALVSPSNGATAVSRTPRLDWNAPSLPTGTNFDQYELQIALEKTFASPVLTQSISGISASEFTLLSTLNPNTVYYWRVRGLNTLGQAGSWSATWSFKTSN